MALFLSILRIHWVRTSTKILILLIVSLISENASAQLVAGFTSNVQQGCSPLVVAFKDASSGNPQQWLWDLGNGALSVEQNPSAVYIDPGTYTVKLYIKSGNNIDSLV